MRRIVMAVAGVASPTWFLENGERYSGAMPLEQVRALLDAASPAARDGGGK
ncbi:MAG: hypothetical protein WAO95_10140 [Burkholderiales bacterium]